MPAPPEPPHLAPTRAPPPPEPREETHERLLPPELSGESSSDEDDESQAGPRFSAGAPVEVLRSDGRWTMARVVDYDAGGATYTVQVADGRCKYFVEEDEVRIPRFLLLSTASI